MAEAQQAVIDAGDGITVVIEDEGLGTRIDPATGDVETDQPDGGVVVQFNAGGRSGEADGDAADPEKFYENLAGRLGIDKVGLLIDDLIQSVDADNESRSQSLANYARGLDLLGLKLSEPKATVGDSASGQDGLSVVTNPLLLEACLKGWATAVGEMLPADGPAKVENFSTVETGADDDLAEAFERDLNYYLTVLSPEYVPDTSQMLLWGTYFAGAGFKKVYRCPIRRRPVSDSIPNDKLIVSDATKDFGACERITNVIPMRRSRLKRLQMSGYYADIPVELPSQQVNAVDEKIGQVQGTTPRSDARPEDQPYEIWEIQCELFLPEFYVGEAGKFAKGNVPLPFLVTVDKQSRTLLAIRRDWKPEDEDCKRKKMYVKYPYVPGPGFYGTGMLNILGNSSAAMTAAWREALDAGMYASFPGGVIAKLGTRQNSSVIRPAPGEFAPIETNGLPIKEVIDSLPYKDVTPGLMALIDKITAQAKSVGTAAEVPVGEGMQNVPVGTMMAYIEQATKIMAAAHKGMHTAQSEELVLIADLFREDPESFWRGNKVAPENFWDQDKLFAALNRCNLVPRSDPNVPSHVHRLMKAVALSQIATMPQFEEQLDQGKVLDRILRAMHENPTDLRKPPPAPGTPPPPPSPEQVTASAKQTDANTKQMKTAADIQNAAADRELEEKKLSFAQQTQSIGLAKELIIHGSDQKNADRQHVMATQQHALKVADSAHQATMDVLDAAKPEPVKPVGDES